MAASRVDREEFEAAFNSRTLAYLSDFRADHRPVVVAIGDGAHSAAGHVLATALVNQLCRAHRRIVIVGDLDQALLCFDHFAAGTLAGATVGLARAVNPFIEVGRARDIPSDALLTIGVGCDADLRVGCDGWLARFGGDAEIVDRPESIFGASLASCFASAVAFHHQRGVGGQLEGAFSLWRDGRRSHEQGPGFAGPLDLGRVLQVGAGGVGSAFLYWLGFIGLAGDWTVVDGDAVEFSNLNRQLLFLAADAGIAGSGENKARVAARRLPGIGTVSERWYGEDGEIVDRTCDLALPLANEYAARELIQARGQTVLLHATTSRSWQAQFHRHVAGRDDCVSCRLPEQQQARFQCATAPVLDSDAGDDASLPFLCGLAGLLLVSGAVKLATGTLVDNASNFVALDLRGAEPVCQAAIYRCNEVCTTYLDAGTRAALAAGTRFAALDGAC